MEKRRSLYFAHPVNTYDTDIEKEILMLLAKEFSDFHIENPNQKHHQKGYFQWKERFKGHPTKSGMSYYYEVVLPACSGAVCLTFLDGRWGMGVAGEAAFFLERKQAVYVIDPNRTIVRITSIESETIKEEIDKKIKKRILVLSIEETVRRVWGPGEPYKKIYPFEKSHLIDIKV